MLHRIWKRSLYTFSLTALCTVQAAAQQPQIVDIPPTPIAPKADSPTLLPAQPSRPVFGTPVSKPSVPNSPVISEAPPVLPVMDLLTLEQCLDLGMQYQPALAAARASLSAAQIGRQSVDKLIIPRLFTPDLPIRRQQACHGVTIAEAALLQAEQETRYAVTRNFFTVQYVRSQQQVINDVLSDMTKARKRAEEIYKSGHVNSKITALDLEAIDIQIALVRGKKATADNGMAKAQAALREAMGVRYDFALNLVNVGLPPAAYKFQLDSLIGDALANRAEMTQAHAANRITGLEVDAQRRIRGWQGKAFPISGDIHAKQIPQGVFNNEYRPGAIGIEYPPMLIGRKFDRVDRASAFNDRANAVVEKTHILISLDVEAMYLKWNEAHQQIAYLNDANKLAQPLLDKIIERSKKTPGQLSGGDIIQASTVAITVRTQLNEAMHTHALALAGLQRATGGAFSIYPIPGAPQNVQKK